MADHVMVGDGGITEDDIRLLSTPVPDDQGKTPNTPAAGNEGEPVQRQEIAPVEKPEGDPVDDHEVEDDDERSTTVDEELDAAQNESEREAIRARRRQERQTKRQRAKERQDMMARQIKDLKAQNNKLSKQVEAIVQVNHSGQIAQLQSAEAQADGVINQLEAAKAAAVTANDGLRAVEADRKIREVMDYKTRLVAAREQAEVQAKKPQQQHLDPDMISHADNFRKENPWFKGVGAPDEHSKIIAALDNQLFSEGWDPATPEYWKELRTRGAKYLPDRFNKGGAQPQGGSYNATQGTGSQGSSRNNRSPVVGGNSGASASQPGGSRTTQLSAGRVQAIRDAGKWDNVTERNKMIRAYQQYDKEHPNK